jgi:hypothetical protein
MSTDPIQLAQDIIGTAGKDDYQIAPTTHATTFASQAPELAAILRTSGVGLAARDYEAKDSEANDAETEFKRIFDRSNLSVFLTSIMIVFVLATGVLNPANAKILLVTFGLLSFLGGSIASYYLNVLKQGKLLDNWMSNRARAEAARLDYFMSIAKAAPLANLGNAFELIKLEYFRRFQLDVQLNYFSSASKKQAIAARKALKWSSIAVAGAGTITALAGFTGGYINPKFAALATLGTLFAGLSTYATTREDVYHNQRNAERYCRTEEALIEIYKRIDDVRRAVLTDGQKPLLDFIGAVHEQLLAEHKQWLGLETEAENAFTKLQDGLDKSVGKLPAR